MSVNFKWGICTFFVMAFAASCLSGCHSDSTNPVGSSGPVPTAVPTCSVNLSNIHDDPWPTTGNAFVLQNATNCPAFSFQVDGGYPITVVGGHVYVVTYPSGSGLLHSVSISGCDFSTSTTIYDSAVPGGGCGCPELHAACNGSGSYYIYAN